MKKSKKSAKKADFSEQKELILRAQKNDNESWDKLIAIHAPRMRAYAYILLPDYAPVIQPIDLQEAFYTAIHSAVISFRPGNKRFESYFLSVYKHELSKVLEEFGYFTPGRVISLDEPISDSADDDVLVFADRISVDDDMSYIDAEHIRESYDKVVKSLNDPIAMKIVDMRRQKKTFQEISEELGLSVKVCWKKFQKFLSVTKRALKDSV